MLHIRLLGGFQLTFDNKPLAIRSMRVQSLLAYLVLHPDLPHARQQLAFLFWPASPEHQAYTNLRKLIYQLRQTLPQINDFLLDDKHTLQWRRAAPYTLDVEELSELLAQSKSPGFDLKCLTRIVDLYTGELLPSCYDEWISPLRQQYHQGVRQALEQLILALENQRAYAEGLRYAQRLLDLDPLEEATYRHLMRLRALRGDRTGVLRVYRQCVQVLQEELGVEPSLETQQTYAQVVDLLPTTSASTASGDGTIESSIPLVGRTQEWARLQAAWQQTLQGRAQLVTISGEAGIGKTRLAEELLSWAGYHGAVTARTHSYAAQGTFAYAPMVELLRSPALRIRYEKLAAVWRAEIARILPELLEADPQLSAPEPLRESWQRQRFWEALVQALRGDEQQPLCLLLDDLQWCDQETLLWLQYFLQNRPQARLLVVGTVRDDELVPDHPFTALQLDLQRTDQFQQIGLIALSDSETSALANQLASEAMTEVQAEQLFRETEGNPLFVVETMRAGLQVEQGEQDKSTRVPSTIQAVIAGRLAQLSPPARQLAQFAATIGRDFTPDLLEVASGLDEEAVIQAIDELWRRRIVHEQENGYDFSHDTIRKVAYQEIGKPRQRLLHRKVATALEQIHAHALKHVVGQLASHYERAGMAEQAVFYYHQAAEASYQLHALKVTEGYLHRGLDLLASVADRSLHVQLEMQMQTLLGRVLAATKGYTSPHTGEALHRALELAHQLDRPPSLFEILAALRRFHYMRAEYQEALDIARQLLLLAQEETDKSLLLVAHHGVGIMLRDTRRLVEARAHLEKALTFPSLQQSQELALRFGQDPYIDCLRFLAQMLWDLGYADKARTRSNEGVALATAMHHPISLVMTLGMRALIHYKRGEYESAQRDYGQVTALAKEHSLKFWLTWSTCNLGRILTSQGHLYEGISMMEEGIADFLHGAGARGVDVWLAELGKAYVQNQQVEKGLAALEEAIARAQKPFVGPSSYSIICEAFRLMSRLEEAETYAQQTLMIARQQALKSYELRAAMTLSRVWQEQDKQEQAYTILCEVYSWFTEGFDTADLVEARALLAQLSNR